MNAQRRAEIEATVALTEERMADLRRMADCGEDVVTGVRNVVGEVEPLVAIVRELLGPAPCPMCNGHKTVEAPFEPERGFDSLPRVCHACAGTGRAP